MSVTVVSHSVHPIAPVAASPVARAPVHAVGRAEVPAETRAPVTDSPELAQAELRLSDWVHGPSGKTPDGKAKIADLLEQVDTIKASIRKANEAGAMARPPLQAGAVPLGPDSRGTLLNLQA